MYDEFEALLVERRDAALWIAMTEVAEINGELVRAFELAARDEAVRVIVLTGAVERVFCVGKGGSVAPTDQAAKNAYWVAGMHGAREVILGILACDKPVIGRINGHAVGKGCSIALCCDITIMVEKAKIGDTHVNVGLVAGDGGSLLWPELVGSMRAKRYLLTGDLLTGKEAEEIGLITEAVAGEDLDARTQHWVDRMSKGAPMAVALTKRAINARIRAQAPAHMGMSLGYETLSFMTRDYEEGVAALLEGRPGRFEGR